MPSALDIARPPAAPSASPRPISPSRTLSTTTARSAGSRSSRNGLTEGRIARPVSAATAAPARPSTWGSAPDRIPRIIASTIITIATRSRRFTAGSCHTSRCGASQAPRAHRSGYGTSSLIAGASPSAEIVQVPEARTPRSTATRVELGDLDAHLVARAGALDDGQVDRLRGVVLHDLDRVERVARFHAAVPAEIGEGLAIVGDRGAEQLDVGVAQVDQALHRAQVLGFAEE